MKIVKDKPIRLSGKRPPKEGIEQRLDRLERENRKLSEDLARAIRRIPNANLPSGGLRPICHAHQRIC